MNEYPHVVLVRNNTLDGVYTNSTGSSIVTYVTPLLINTLDHSCECRRFTMPVGPSPKLNLVHFGKLPIIGGKCRSSSVLIGRNIA